MKKSLLWAGFALALAFLILSITNASWLAPDPKGAPKQIANGAIGPEFQDIEYSPVDLPSKCGWTSIYDPTSRHIANTSGSILRADRMGGWLIEVDAQVSADGKAVLFGSPALDCLTDGTGAVKEKTAEELAAFDAGYGYAVIEDGKEAFPYRGQGLTIPTLEDVLRTIPRQARLMVHLQSDDPAIVTAIRQAFTALDRNPADTGDGFYGSSKAIAAIRETYPEAWAFTAQEARQCTADYTATGWMGFVPESCEGGTMLIALDDQTFLWGWPNRLISRLEEAGAKIIIEAPGGVDGEPAGITLPEQLTQIPSTFNGYIWTDDAFATLPALIQRYDNRTQEEIDATQAALERRRSGASGNQ